MYVFCSSLHIHIIFAYDVAWHLYRRLLVVVPNILPSMTSYQYYVPYIHFDIFVAINRHL